MADPFAVEVAVCRFTVWRGALVVLALATIGSETGWALSRSGWPLVGQMLVAGGGAVAILGIVASLWIVEAGVLRCRNAAWSYVPDGASEVENAPAFAVEVEVALDLGSFVLLRLLPVARQNTGRRARWLPVQSAASHAQWQALRCALYQPRPELADSAGAARGGLAP